MRHGGIRGVCAAAVLMAVPAPTVVAIAQTNPGRAAYVHDPVAWQKDREGLFAKFKASHPPQDAAIAAIKEQTAALVKGAGPATNGPPVIWRTPGEPLVVFDTPVGPRLVVVPAGEATLGSAAGEPGRIPGELPRHRVRFDHAFAVSMFPITYGEYAAFVFETKRTSPACVTLEAGHFAARTGRDWANAGFDQSFRSPATCIGFDDAMDYAAWLAAKTGQRYRLLTEAEYEYAERAGTTTAYWWGDDADAGCGGANGFDQDAKPNAPAMAASACHDGHAFTMLLDQSKPNPFGLYDTAGNVASWTSDCWQMDRAGGCRSRVLRGGSWASSPPALRAAARERGDTRIRDARQGFRVARDL